MAPGGLGRCGTVRPFVHEVLHRRVREVVEGDHDETFDLCYNIGWQGLEARKDGRRINPTFATKRSSRA
ncbi:MAG: hypothetical protein ACYTF6_08225 [Planctomycetota bacterium]|jgi:hypothetical protein